MPIKGVILDILKTGWYIKPTDSVYVNTDNGSFTIPVKDIYLTRDALIQAMNDEADKIVAEYKAGIHTAEDLIRFMYEKPVGHCEEYTDYEARRAVKELALELLGITLD